MFIYVSIVCAGQVYLYVISHQPTMNVDKFRFDESKLSLTHVRRINDPNFII